MSEVYRVGVAIAMSTSGMGALGAIGRHLMGLGREAKALESELKAVKAAALGAMAAIGGGVVLHGLNVAVKAGAELVQQQNRMKQAGISQIDIARATAEAWQLTYTVVNRGVTENLAMIQGLRNAAGSMMAAIELAPAAVKPETVLASITGKKREGLGAAAFRFLQLRGSLINRQTGQIDIQEAARWAKIMEVITAATHRHRTDVTPYELRRFQLQAGMSGSGPDETGLSELAPLIGHVKGSGGGSGRGSRVGTGLYQVIKQLVTPTNRKELDELTKPDLIDPRKVLIRRGGKIVEDHGSLKGQEFLEKRFIEWIDRDFSPALKKAGAMTLQDQASMTTQVNLSASVARAIREALRESPELKVKQGNALKAIETGQYKTAAKSPTAPIESFEKTWHNLLTALGSPLVNDATGTLAKITTGIDGLAVTAAKDLKLTEDLELIGAGNAAMAVIGGSVAIINAAASALGLFAIGRAAAAGLVLLGGTALRGAASGFALFAGGNDAAVGMSSLGTNLAGLGATITKYNWSRLGALSSVLGAPWKAAHTNLPADLRQRLNKQDSFHWPSLPDWLAGKHSAPVPPAAVPAAPPAPGTTAPIRNESYETPVNAPPLHVTLIGDVHMDGQTVGRVVAQQMAAHATLPPASGTGYDPSMTPTFTAHLIGNA